MSSSKTKKMNPADPLAARDLIDTGQANDLTALYKVLANPHRLRLLHALARAGELPVGELATEVSMSVQAVSNQLQRLADQQIVAVRREGNHAYYRVIDPCVGGLLELGICLVDQHPPNRP